MRRPTSAARASPAPGSSSANSSPPRRATRPALADRVLQARAELGEQAVAGVVAERVVEVLEAVEVDHRHGEPAVAALASSSRRRSWNARRFASPVSSSVSASAREWCSSVFSTNVSAIRTSDERRAWRPASSTAARARAVEVVEHEQAAGDEREHASA